MVALKEAPRQAKRTLRIVVADDDPDAVLALATLLRLEGHLVLESIGGDSVINLVDHYRPDVVLLDIGMPGRTGFQIARELRETLAEACPLLVAVTAWTQPRAREIGKLVGFKHYLTKPYSTEELLSVLAPLTLRGGGLKL